MSKTHSPGGLTFFGALTLVFITLKLTEVIDWSWWWVLSPLWISGAFILLLLGVMAVVFVVGALWEARR